MEELQKDVIYFTRLWQEEMSRREKAETALADLVATAPDVVEALNEAAEHIDRNADSVRAGIFEVDEKIYANQIKTRGDKLTVAVERAQKVMK